jgi:Domain of unknown function (DUF5916)
VCDVGRALVLAVALALYMVPAAGAQEGAATDGPVSLRALRLTEGQPIRIDGLLDEPVWTSPDVATDFLQREPDNGAPATERTEVRAAYDEKRLILGVKLFDSEPERILGNQMQRDEGFGGDDRFIVTIDPFLNGRTGYVFQTNPLGSLQDGLVTPTTDNDNQARNFGGGINRSWDGIWTVRVRRGADGWTLEMEIPFATLNFDRTLSAWGVNFQRTVRRKAEESVWSGHLRNEGVAHMASAGRLEGLSGLSQGMGLDVKPYVVGNVSQAPGRGQEGALGTGDVGVDLFYNLTPALRANVSVNTDFAETEVDARQVNLTRFPLFFEEKREFFLQGAGYFDFGREVGNAVTPFFSRRVGLDSEGVPQPIDVGAKLTGQVGAFDVGVLQVRTAGARGQPGEDFSIARVRRRLFQESYFGGLVTRRAARGPGASDVHTLGVDGVLRTSQFLGSKTVEWSSWFLYTTNPADTGLNIGRGSRLSFPNDPFYFDMSYRELQPNYDPAVGYTQRVGFRRFNPQMGYSWRFGNSRWFQSIQHEIDWERLYDMDNRLLTEVAAIKPLTIRFSEGSEFAYEAHPTYERLEEDFEISNGVILPIGQDYRFTRHEFTGQMANRYPVALEGKAAFGRFYSGTSEEYEAVVSVRPRPGIALELEAQHNAVDLPEGRFKTNLIRLVTNTQFSPWVSLVNNIQYDDVTDSLGWQLRFRWIQRPGNDLFLVYSHNWQEMPSSGRRSFETLDSRLATKIVYTLRF